MIASRQGMRVLGVEFHNGTAAMAVEAGMQGGLVVVPSAPVLVDVASNPALREAVLGADLAITDSGLMVLMWRLLTGEKLVRVSGLEYLKLLLKELRKREAADGTAASAGPTTDFGRVFWVMPTVAARDRNITWLRSQGFQATADDCYIAPVYPPDGPLSDRQLVELVLQRQPAHIILALGGGVQERLGWFLKQELEKVKNSATPLLAAANPGYVPEPASSSAVPGIHCIGAAIGFLSGDQVRIPVWVDYLYLGWLWRSLSNPRRFVPRYWKAFRLIPLMIRYREKAPGDATAKSQGVRA